MKCDKCDKESVRTSIRSHLCEDQLFPQPLDDKELREKIAEYLYELRQAGTMVLFAFGVRGYIIPIKAKRGA